MIDEKKIALRKKDIALVLVITTMDILCCWFLEQIQGYLNFSIVSIIFDSF